MWFASQSHHSTVKLLSKIIHVDTTYVSQLYVFELLPNSFDWIEVRRMTWQRFQMNHSCTSFGKIPSNHRPAIPNHDDPSQQPGQMFEKAHRICTRESNCSDPCINLPSHRHSAHHRQMSACVKDSQYRRLATRSVCAYKTRKQIKSRFINKYYGRAFFRRLFLISGHRFCRHCSILFSSRWAARSKGICGVQPNCFRRRETWALLYETSNSCAIRALMRSQVQISPRNPYDSAPGKSSWGRVCSWWEESFGGLPERATLSQGWPLLSEFRENHWLTAASETPNISAISRWVQPSSLSWKALRRRSSRQSESGELDCLIHELSNNLSYLCNDL